MQQLFKVIVLFNVYDINAASGTLGFPNFSVAHALISVYIQGSQSKTLT